MTTQSPASMAPSSRPEIHRPTRQASVALRKSPKNTMRPSFVPMARRALVAPVFLLPTLRRSGPPVIFDTMIPVEIDPSR